RHCWHPVEMPTILPRAARRSCCTKSVRPLGRTWEDSQSWRRRDFVDASACRVLSFAAPFVTLAKKGEAGCSVPQPRDPDDAGIRQPQELSEFVALRSAALLTTKPRDYRGHIERPKMTVAPLPLQAFNLVLVGDCL